MGECVTGAALCPHTAAGYSLTHRLLLKKFRKIKNPPLFFIKLRGSHCHSSQSGGEEARHQQPLGACFGAGKHPHVAPRRAEQL